MKIPKPRKLNSGRWNVQVTSAGKRISVTADTKRECQERAMAEMLRAGRVPAAPDLTLRQAVEAFICSRDAVISPSTVNAYRSMARTRFRSVQDQKLRQIHWQNAVNDEARIVAPKTVKNAWSLIESTYKFVGEPVPQVRLPQVPRSDRPWLTPEEVQIFVAEIREQPVEVAALLALHGLRRSEIFALAYKDIDARAIHVRGAMVEGAAYRPVLKDTNKTRSSARDVPIVIPRLAELIEKQRPEHAPCDLILTCDLATPRMQVNRICRAAGLPEVGMHGLRHSFASLAYSVGMSARETMAIGGWSDVGTMQKIYTHIDQALAEERALQIRGVFK